ncbi:GAF domain-containing protein [Pedobacter deserti]|uniref:GAF domain-containing protein n=1 Tax=Pedobacter deserti TaxID=2817382 RepID=UPI00210C1C98|nr:GAF domain-containing protein [Pedobacter sp. SYSU D00382]
MKQQHQEFLLAFSDSLRSLPGEAEIEETGLRMLAEFLKLDRAYVFVLYPADDRAVVRAEYRNESLVSILGEVRMSDFPETVRQIEDQTIVFNDIDSDVRLSDLNRNSLRAVNLQAFICASVRKGEKNVLWSIAAAVNTPRTWTNNEVALVETVAERMWAAAEIVDKITERKRREEQQAFLLEYSDMLRTLSSEVSIKEQTVKMLSEYLGLDRCWISEVFEENGHSTVAPQYHRPDLMPMPEVFQLTDFPETMRQLATESMFIPDVRVDSRFSETEQALLAGLDLRALLVVALRRGPEKVVWALAAVNTTPRHWLESERELLGEVAERLWQSVKRARTEAALRESEARTRKIIDTGAVSVLFFNQTGKVVDANETFRQTLGWTREDIDGGALTWQMMTPPEWLESCASLVQQLENTGSIPPSEKEYLHKDGRRVWMLIAARDLGDGTIVEFAIDISARKQAEAALQETERQYRLQLEAEVQERTQELQASRKLLQATLDSNQEMIQVFEAVRDQNGQIIDFIWILNNNAAAEVYGDVIGKSLLTYNPGVKDEGIFDAFVEVTETGIPKQYEKHYVHEQFNGWFHQSVVKLNDGVATNTVNISSRKEAENERFRTVRESEAKIRKMEAEQQLEIFRVSLSTLEEERYRISESLHNGIAQILYGIKINLTAFRPDMLPEDFKENKAYLSKLLTEAIVETRRISHELMPTTLEQFGLKSAIDDICFQLSGDTTFHCQVTGVCPRMAKYLELAIYRTTQELMTNVVKHARATVCDVSIHIDRKQVTIVVRDNGQGMTDTKTNKPGIGLASIRSKIKLLNGEVRVDSTPGTGTTVEIIIPQPAQKKI